MPIYEYRCPNCNSKFELLRGLSKANEGAECPRCHTPAERILSCFSAVSKGDGGQTASIGGGGGCSSCSSASCSTCG